MSLSPVRLAAIYAATPSEAAMARSYRAGAASEQQAIDMVHARRIETAERHARGEHYGSNTGHRIIPFADCLTPEQWDVAGAGLETRFPVSAIQAARDARPSHPLSRANVQRASRQVAIERRRVGRVA